MKFAIFGGDRRQIETALILKSKGHDVCVFGLPAVSGLVTADDLNSAVTNADAVVLPLPVTRDGKTVNSPLCGDVIFLGDIIKYRPKMLYGGIIKQNLTDELDAAGIKFRDYFKSEALTIKNAVLTAEAAIAIAINGTDNAIFGSKSLVIGYGRIGRKLSYYLKALGAKVTATSRDKGTRATILADGFIPMDTAEVRTSSNDFDYIFNTVPSPIMDSVFFSNCKKTVFVEDLATDAGTDFAAATRLNINAGCYGGLPGKHSPVSAAYFITEEILNS